MTRVLATALAALLAAIASTAATQRPVDGITYWPAETRKRQLAYERALNAIPDAARIARYHERVASIAHEAGSDGDRETIAILETLFREAGLDVERHPIWVYLPRFVNASIEIVTADGSMSLPLRERPLDEDRFSRDPALLPGHNAFAASGDVTAEVVYANYGTPADFAKLRAHGIDCTGKIVIARYGRNYRGFKAKFAEAAGAAGLIIYTDPADSGYARGIMYPEGGFANPSQIQRGSVLTLPYPGDPLTPFRPATKDADRLDPKDVALPKIPVQPIGWAAAHEIMKRMRGKGVPSGWQGGLPLAYRLTGGADLKVRLMVEQERAVRPTANVIARLPGSTHPEQTIVFGCHHDAWGYGAGDPMAGMIVMLEAARALGEMAKRGERPARTIVFAAWAAEEPGIIGSTEWVEANREALARDGIAYVNLDMAAMGTQFRGAAAPALRAIIADATRAVAQVGTTDRTVFDVWSAGGADATAPGLPRMGSLGGGSDHVGFYCHVGVPSAGIGVGGARGVSYHSIYDNLAWYRKVVGNYDGATMLTKVVNVLAARLANAPLLPYEPHRILAQLRFELTTLGPKTGHGAEAADVSGRTVKLERRMRDAYRRMRVGVAAGKLAPKTVATLNRCLIDWERAWIDPRGLPERPWYRNLYAATDENSGYAAWLLPGLHHAIGRRDATIAARELDKIAAAVERLTAILDRIEAALAAE